MQDVTGLGHHTFVETLAGAAAEIGDVRLAGLVADLRAPLRVGVEGRPGTGRRTVARALRGAGVTVVPAASARDVEVYVVAETLKPEDRAAIAGSARPHVVVLNKADLAGFGGDGPLAAARDRCRRLQAQTGVPTHPLVGLLAALDEAVLDDALLDALRVLATEPADLGSTDGFVDSPHRLPRATRERLLAGLDIFGIAHAVLALRRRGCGADRSAIIAALRRVSALDRVLAAIDEAAAPVRHRRIAAVLTGLTVLATGPRGARIAELVAGDDLVVARMSAAVDVVEAAGMTVDPAEDNAAHLSRAVDWQRYSRGPVSPLHRACGADIVRGSLRLWARAGGVPGTAR